MRKHTIQLLAAAFLTLPAIAQEANAFADHIQDARHRAGSLVEKAHPSKAEIDSCIAILDSALHALDSTPVRALAIGSPYLFYRSHDVNYDLASAYSLAGKPDSAFYYLDRMQAVGSNSGTATWLIKDSTFQPLWSDPRFTNLIAKLKRQGRLWSDSAFITPYKPELSYEEKVAGLSLLWSKAKYNFANFEHTTTDWDQTYLDYLAQIKNTTTTKDYYHLMMRFYAQLKDGHSNVMPPPAIATAFYSRPPMRTALIEGRVFVTEVWSDSLRRTGITPGLEILQIDGQPVTVYAEKNVAPYQSSSTPQDLKVREYTYALLAGADTPVTLTCKEKTGKTWTRSIARTGYTDIKRRPAVEFKRIGDIGYLALNAFEDQNMIKQVDSLFPEIDKTSALIIDVRINGGGSADIGFNILSMLTDKPFALSEAKLRLYRSTAHEEQEWSPFLPETWRPSKKHFYNKPVALLIGPQTFSAAEDFTVAFDAMHRGPLIGNTTGGSTGAPIFFPLPGGGSARICAKHDTYPGGKEFVGIGIAPNVPVPPTISDLQTGKDAALQKAIETINSKSSVASTK